MKQLFLSALLFFSLTNLVYAQNPIHWQYTCTKTGESTYELHFTATIDQGWHAYSQTQPENAVARPTFFKFNVNPLIQFKGKPREVGALIKWSDNATGIAAHQYEGKVDFVQTIGLKAKVKTMVNGNLTFQACTDEMCLSPKTVAFSIEVLSDGTK
jgi:hypothetical protein